MRRPAVGALIVLFAACAASAAPRPQLRARGVHKSWWTTPLAEDLRRTSDNLADLEEFLGSGERATRPSAEDEAWAREALARELAACDRLLEAGEKLLAKGIARKKPPKGTKSFLILFFPEMPMRVPPADVQLDLAVAELNAAGTMAGLIENRSREYEGRAREEPQLVEQLARARKELVAARAAYKKGSVGLHD